MLSKFKYVLGLLYRVCIAVPVLVFDPGCTEQGLAVTREGTAGSKLEPSGMLRKSHGCVQRSLQGTRFNFQGKTCSMMAHAEAVSTGSGVTNDHAVEST
jgi:hypothetical protein